jgi:hypothetical protein
MPPQPHLMRSRPPALLREDDVDHQWLLSAAVAIARMLMAVTLSMMRLRPCLRDIGPAAHAALVSDDVVKRYDERLGHAEGVGKFSGSCAGGKN